MNFSVEDARNPIPGFHSTAAVDKAVASGEKAILLGPKRESSILYQKLSLLYSRGKVH